MPILQNMYVAIKHTQEKDEHIHGGKISPKIVVKYNTDFKLYHGATVTNTSIHRCGNRHLSH